MHSTSKMETIKTNSCSWSNPVLFIFRGWCFSLQSIHRHHLSLKKENHLGLVILRSWNSAFHALVYLKAVLILKTHACLKTKLTNKKKSNNPETCRSFHLNLPFGNYKNGPWFSWLPQKAMFPQHLFLESYIRSLQRFYKRKDANFAIDFRHHPKHDSETNSESA